MQVEDVRVAPRFTNSVWSTVSSVGRGLKRLTVCKRARRTRYICSCRSEPDRAFRAQRLRFRRPADPVDRELAGVSWDDRGTSHAG